MARRRPQPRGWYVKDGDPPGTERFWDGEQWGPKPRQKKLAPGEKVAVAKPKAQLKTDPAEALSHEQGTIWARISARSADILLLVLPLYLLFSQAFTTSDAVNAEGVIEPITETNPLYLWLAVVIAIVYEVGFTATWGRTPGKRMMQLAVVDRETGASPNWVRAFMRATPLFLVAYVLLMPVLYVASVILMRVDRSQRSVFDFAGATLVVAAPRSG
ncbi:MAG: RDD family protein [bacterium]|nr:RDD family protein [bacterium]